MKKGVIFDIDGTLWDAVDSITDSWNRVLKTHKEIKREISSNEMRGYMGMTLETIGEKIFPDVDKKIINKIMNECADKEVDYIREHGGVLYPHLKETLKVLKREYDLFIVSNCQEGYIEALLEYHNLWSFFKDSECSGRTGMVKGENIKLLMERNGLEKCVYVGDTQLDMEGADLAGIPFIYAAYGFGNVDRKVPSIKSPSELPEALKRLM